MKAFALTFTFLVFAACEQAVQTPAWPEYKEEMVICVLASIHMDRTYVYCELGKTVPLNQTADYKTTRINDAKITLMRDTEAMQFPQVQWPSPWSHDRIANYRLDIPTTAARQYSVQVLWGSKNLHGAISVESDVSARLDTIFVVRDSLYSDVFHATYSIHVRPDYDYFVCFENSAGSSSFNDYVRQESVPASGKTVRQSVSIIKGSWNYYVLAMNRKFRIQSTNPGDGIFDPAGNNPPCNMFGDGLGFFAYQFAGDTHTLKVK